jgi:flagellar basal-body rod protein FlgB
MRLFDKTMSVIQGSLDVRLERQNLLAGNVANADTPGFKPRDLHFASALADATRKHLSGSSPSDGAAGDLPLNAVHVARPSTSGDIAAGAPGIDGNRVDLDRTMASLAENALQYGASTKSLSKKLNILRSVITDGGGG